MDRRRIGILVSSATLALSFVGVGCSKGSEPSASSVASASSSASAPDNTPKGTFGSAVVRGVVKFSGKPPEMKVPAKRKQATDACKDKELVHDAIVVKDGKLKDVLVRIAPKSFSGRYEPPKPATVDQLDCTYAPRIQGVVSGQEVLVRNSDKTLHNVHTLLGAETIFNETTMMNAPPITKPLPPEGIIRFGCDIHPWMRGFVVVTDHPFFATSGDDGAFRIERVPAGKYRLEAWHARYGLATQDVTVAEGASVDVVFNYDGNEPEPSENRGELDGLF